MKITKDGIFYSKWEYDTPEQEESAKTYSKGPLDDYRYYIATPFWLPKTGRHLGYTWLPYDCQVHECFGFWYFNISWSTKWSERKWKKV